jgi:ABC-type phosphate/phosphonate transport system substrate-binding protein
MRSPGSPWLARKALNPDIVEAITKALLSLRDNNVLEPFDRKLTSLRPALPADYDALARVIETAALFPKQH